MRRRFCWGNSLKLVDPRYCQVDNNTLKNGRSKVEEITVISHGLTVTVTSRVVAIALGFSPIGVIKHASRLND